MSAGEVPADLAIIGGGVLGLCLAYEAARIGRSTVLFERAPEFAAATSANWFRILHGGLRYLQALDLVRHRESVLARQEWLREFPELVEPLPCLMPLSGRGLKRPAMFKAAFALDAALAFRRNDGIRPDRHLPKGRVLSAADTRTLLPDLDIPGLQGGALWNDAVAKDSMQLAQALAKRAQSAGAVLHADEPIAEILIDGGKVAGVRTGLGVAIAAHAVVDATGPWTDRTLAALQPRRPNRFRPSLAFNLVLDRPAPFDGALAIQARRANAPVLFVYPLQGRLFAGTWHVPWHGDPDEVAPTPGDLQAFVADLADALPHLNIDLEAIQTVHAGLLPVEAPGSIELTDRPILIDHGKAHGPAGLFSAAAIKFTTAPLLARQIVGRLGV